MTASSPSNEEPRKSPLFMLLTAFSNSSNRLRDALFEMEPKLPLNVSSSFGWAITMLLAESTTA